MITPKFDGAGGVFKFRGKVSDTPSPLPSQERRVRRNVGRSTKGGTLTKEKVTSP